MFHFFLLFISLSTFASNLENLANEPKWHKLLHYKKNILGNIQSQADDPKFFLHSNGKFDPLAEIKEAVRLFSENPNPQNGDPACRFPARLKWLNQKLGNSWKINFSGCTRYIDFFSKLAARRASIVFSSYYLGNPNSAFGHTFLRLSRFDDKAETEMLDYGINYAAEARATNPLTYAIKGLFGGYPGRFAAIPYYYKVREYSDHEFRDLWAYELKLDMRQVLEMVDHIWELGHTYFDYYYFHENCSYHLLSIIDVVAPELNLTDDYTLFTIPADTIRHLKDKGLISEGKKRESTYSRLMNLSEKLPTDALKLAKAIAVNPEKTNSLLKFENNQMEANVLDVAIEAFDYFNAETILADDPKAKKLKENILIARAKNPIITKDRKEEDYQKDSPALSHAPSRSSLSQGYDHDQGKETRFEFRFALHDLLDPRPGSLQEAQLEIGKFSFVYKEQNYDSSQIIFENFSLFNLKNYPSQNFWSNPLSWELDIGARQLDLPGCFDCPASLIMGSVGNSLQLMDKKILFSLLFNGEFNLQSHLEHGYRIALGPKLVSRFIFSDKWILGLSGFYHLNTYRFDQVLSDQDLRGEVELRHHVDTNLSLFMKLQGHERDQHLMRQGEIGLRYFL